VLLRGEGIKVSANAFKALRYFEGIASRGALENHVLDEMRKSGLFPPFVSGARADPNTD
jgi:hypothetical protein